MLGRFTFLSAVIGAQLLSAGSFFILKRKMQGKIPPGSITNDNLVSNEKSNAPGTLWSRAGVSFSMGYSMLVLLAVEFFYILDFWEDIAHYLAFDLPYLVNLIGLIGIWLYYIWGTATMLYSPTYIPLWEELPRERYILATGGPYSIIRHPMYVAKGIVLPVLIFFTTGTWTVVFVMLGWIFFPYQAESEEKLLVKRFGEIYTDYAAKTGKFLPHLRKTR
ncbi:MAG: methyltransferase family protein [Candidatus Odinarchaeota archaeon]